MGVAFLLSERTLVPALYTGCFEPCVCVSWSWSRWSKHRSFVNPLNAVLVSPPAMIAIVAVSVTFVLEATLDPAASASGAMVELMDARKNVNREREQKSARNVWLNASNRINTYTVIIILNKTIKY